MATGARMPLVHLSLGALICLGIAFVGITENQKLRRDGASKIEIAATTARNMGFIYIWAATTIAITYLALLSWHEWSHWFMGLALVGTACIFYSNTLSRDAAEGRVDDTMLSIGNKLTWLQLVGMLVAIVGMLIDGKLTRYQNPKLMDWAAQNTFFAGAIGLAILSAYALWAARNDRRGVAA
ncbi:MAG: hypothetical protein AB7U75_18145 [Hyphomicrobiaceae bacterium]